MAGTCLRAKHAAVWRIAPPTPAVADASPQMDLLVGGPSVQSSGCRK